MATTRLLLTALLALAASTLPAAPATAPPGLAGQLQASRWQYRLLLLGAPTASQVDFQRQKAWLADAEAGLAARDFKIIEVLYDQLSSADRQCWTQQLGQPLAGFRVVLVGKDGGVKRTETQPLAPTSLFGTVDKMPMRRQEMRKK